MSNSRKIDGQSILDFTLAAGMLLVVYKIGSRLVSKR